MSLLLTGVGSLASAPAFTPASLPAYVGSPHSVAAMRSSGSLWQNSTKTLQATASGDPVRVAVTAAGDWTAPTDAARMTLTNVSGSKWALYADGIDDALVAPAGVSFAGDFEFLAMVSWRASTTFWHVLSDANQNPAMKRYAAVAYSDQNYQVFNGAALSALAGSDPGAEPTAAHLAGLSRESNALFARVGATDYAPGTSSGDLFGTTALAVASKGIVGEYGAIALYGLALYSARLSAANRAALAAYLTALA